MRKKYRIRKVSSKYSTTYYELQERIWFFFWDTIDTSNSIESLKNYIKHEQDKEVKEVVYSE
jgi:hypothetical protein